MENNSSSFMDSKTILAIAIIGVAWVGWQWHLQKKYPEAYKKTPTTETRTQSVAGSKATVKSDKSGQQNQSRNIEAVKKGETAQAEKVTPENTVRFDDDTWSLDISNKGMGLKNIHLKKYKNRDMQIMIIGGNERPLPFQTNIIGRKNPIIFKVTKQSANQFVGKAIVDGVEVIKTLIINSQNYTIDTRVLVSENGTIPGVTTFLSDKIIKTESSTFLLPTFEKQDFFVAHEESSDRELIVADEDVLQSYKKVRVAAIGSQYFAMGLLDNSDILAEAKIFTESQKMSAVAQIQHNILNPKRDTVVQFTAFIGPKSYDILNGISADMSGIIDFGWFSFIAKYILKLMQLFYNWVGNWGIAIILLTILVRILLLPLVMTSMKSMKSMQKIQPQLKALREQLKDDPQKMNQETLKLMRENKANPVGGCLPMLLQFPIFIALYQVLGQSVELYQAPFAFWIYDLSLKDPFYVLPVLMGITMFVQFKVTPSTMDPTQQKIMMFMPIMFSLFMITLPSGLTLYIFVSALFAVVQQILIINDKKTAAKVS